MTSFPVCRTFEESPMLYSFVLVYTFQYVKILPSKIFDLYAQYVYEIKAENILNSNLALKSKVCLKISCGDDFLMLLYRGSC